MTASGAREGLSRRRMIELLGAATLAPLAACGERRSRGATMQDSAAGGFPMRTAVLDPGLSARVVSRTPLLYRGGADASLDRPRHVRAGSGLSWLHARLLVIQDDANFLAVVDPATGRADAITLPAGDGGVRQFDDSRGNKDAKLDLEACCVVQGIDGPLFLAFGSGSSARRRHVVVADRWNERAPRVRLVDASTLYRVLEEATDFAGSELNIEGAVAVLGVVKLIGRGNGAARDGLVARNATCDLSLVDLLAYVEDPKLSPPEPMAITPFGLDALDGLPLGFTDATLLGGTLVYTATAEASPSATEDGRVTGSVLGLVPSTGDLRYTPIRDERDAIIARKVEGVVPVPGSTNRVLVVVDSDDATEPSELWTVQLGGRWDVASPR